MTFPLNEYIDTHGISGSPMPTHANEIDTSHFSHHEMIVLTPELELGLGNVLQAKSPLDTNQIKAVEYLNSIFPNEQSLANADRIIAQLKHQMSILDSEISLLLRTQAEGGGEAVKLEIENVKKAMQEMMNRIQIIKQKAIESEEMVIEITKDIKNLDLSKKNLTISITVLRRLQMLVSALEQLKGMASRKQYLETSQLLQVVLQLLVHFKSYKGVKQISGYFDSVRAFQIELKQSIFSEFDQAFNTGILKLQTQLLNDACIVLEVLDLEVNSQVALTDWYCDNQLKDYKSLFKSNYEVSGLDAIARRFAWLKRLLKAFDEEHTNVFPNHWKMAEHLCEKFCLETRKDLIDVCARSELSLDVNLLVQAVQTTIEFEEKLDKRFPQKNELGKTKFNRIISSCYEPYFKVFVEQQDKKISEMFIGYHDKKIKDEDDTIVSSSTDLFYFYRQTLQNFSQFSNRKSLLELGKLFGKWLKAFGDLLSSKLPRDEKKGLTEEDIKVICIILNTTDYCSTTTQQLEERIIDILDEEFKSQISYSSECDAFMSIAGVALSVLVKGVENSLDPCLTTMIRRSWSTIESVGDQSEYITQIAVSLSGIVQKIRKYLSSQRYFKSFCDKFTESFLSKFYTTIFKCRPLPETGAEQMLLDTIALKNIFLKMVQIGNKDGATSASTTFVKIVNKGISKAEQLLKVVIRSHEPPEGLVETYLTIYQNEQNPQHFQKILELKGLKRAEQVGIIEVLQKKSTNIGILENVKIMSNTIATGAPVVPEKSGSSDGTTELKELHTNPLPTSLGLNQGGTTSQGTSKKPFQTDFRKFMTGMSSKKT